MIALALSLLIFTQEFALANAQEGEKLWKQYNCALCHSLTEKKEPSHVGPPLLGVTKKQKHEWLVKWIQKPDEMSKTDPIGKALFEEYKKVPMPNFGITEAGAESLYQYLKANDEKTKDGKDTQPKKKKKKG